MPHPLSILITTHNEADHLPALLAGIAGWSDDVLVVDSFSTDATPDLARKGGARVLQRAYAGPADQKNWAIPQLKYEWVLILDADERVSPELRAEIDALPADAPIDAYWIPRRNYFMGREVRFSGWQGDAVVRLIRRDRCRYDGKQVHEEIDTANLRIARLRHPIDHYTFRSAAHFLAKMERYARWSAQDHAGRTPKVGFYHLAVKPAFRFFKHYVLQQGFRDGKVGFVISAIMAWGVFLRYLNLLEARRSNRPAPQNNG